MPTLDTKPFPENLIPILKQIGDLTPDFIDDLKRHLQYVAIAKNQKWVERGEVCRKVIFLEKGFMYSNLEEENYTSTTWFMKENDFVFSVESFLTQTASSEAIFTLEDTIGYFLTYTDLRMLIDKHLCFLKVYANLIERYYVLSEKRAANLRKREALDRYKFLIQYHPEIIKRVPLKLIASYLCIKQETLSRIRTKV